MALCALVEQAKTRIPQLSAAEVQILQAAAEGREASAARESVIRAEVLEWLCTSEEASRNVHRHGLALYDFTITGLLDLIHAEVRFPIQLRRCVFEGQMWLKSARLRSLSFRGCTLRDLIADSAVIGTNLLFIEGCEVFGEVALRGAVIEGDLRTDGSTFHGTNGSALVCDRSRISGGVFLSRTASAGRFSGEVRFAGAQVGGNFDCEGAILDNNRGTSLNLERLVVAGGLFLRGSQSSGVVNISTASIAITLDCREAKMRGNVDRAFHAERVSVGSHALLDGAFSCAHVHMLGADIGGGLRCRASSIKKLDLRYAKIDAQFEWTDMADAKDSTIDLRDAHVGSIKDDLASWPEKGGLLLDGLTYERFSDSADGVNTRLQWLELDKTRPVSAYRQLSRVFESHGHKQDATRLLFALEKLVRSRDTYLPRRIWNAVLHATIGYGFQLWRTAVLMALLIAAGSGVAGLGYRTKLIAPTDKAANALFISDYRVPTQYPRFSSTVFSIEHSLPGLNLGVSGSWSADTTADVPRHHWLDVFVRVWFWLQTAVGWILSIFFLAGISGVVKKTS